MGAATSVVKSLLGPARPDLTASHVDTLRFMGRWYQWGATPNFFQRTGAPDVITVYHLVNLQDDKTARFSVNNYEPQTTRDNDESTVRHVHGIARTSPDQLGDVAKYNVEYEGTTGMNSQYWIYDIATVEGEDEPYSWAIVGDSTLSYMWVLVRDPFTAEYDPMIREAIQRLEAKHANIKIESRMGKTEHTDFWKQYDPPFEHHGSQRDGVRTHIDHAIPRTQISHEINEDTHHATDFSC